MLRSRFRRLLGAVSLAATAYSVQACGGSSTAPGPTATVVTESYAGQTRGTPSGGCAGDSHNLSIAEGPVAVTLVQSTGSAEMRVQVCAGGIDNNNCTINQTRIAVGQTLTGARKGAAAQNLKLLSSACVTGSAEALSPVDYTVNVTYPRAG
jgi:hypothetical protein